MKKAIALFFVMLFALVVMFYEPIACPFCNTTSTWFTGNTELISGKFWKEYKCAFGHTFLVRDR